jgi:RNA polymerase sigma factor (sigma-70 family)
MTSRLHSFGRLQRHADEKGNRMTEDARLLEAWHTGDVQAFEALFCRHYERVHRILYGMVGSEADDLAQEVFMRLHDHPPAYVDGTLAPWLYRVAVNLGRRCHRSRNRWQRYRDRLAWLTGGLGWQPHGDDPAESAQHSDEQRAVRAVLARLKDRDADILILRYSGLSYREIAQVLDVAAGSVGTLLSRAEERFRAVYEALYGGCDV